jgi:hypothetical protein
MDELLLELKLGSASTSVERTQQDVLEIGSTRGRNSQEAKSSFKTSSKLDCTGRRDIIGNREEFGGRLMLPEEENKKYRADGTHRE